MKKQTKDSKIKENEYHLGKKNKYAGTVFYSMKKQEEIAVIIQEGIKKEGTVIDISL